MVPEAQLEHSAHGTFPVGDGWFVVNARDAQWFESNGLGFYAPFEGENAPFGEPGINLTIIAPGEASAMYHGEEAQEGFLVLSGECVAVVEGEERRMGPWDYLHCPPGTAHITVGAGDGPCAILMVGTRASDDTIHYPVEPAAAAHGASVETATDVPKEVYADRPPIVPARSPWPLG